MKILAIRGKNLASLEGEFEIDFKREPLKSSGIFAITGSTGSGKSTLLDALCLALFDNTPRLKNAAENGVKITDIDNATINQDDNRTILRRGTSDAYAEVDFISLGGEQYRSRWMVRRARDRADGRLGKAEFRLTNLSTGTEVQGVKTELLSKISELIGLTFFQFTRSVLLAQGDFATFLKATQKEKAELLEKLTGTDIYSRISAKIYEKSKQAEQELNTLNERIKDIALLSDEELETLNQEKQSVKKEIGLLTVETEQLSNKIKWLSEKELLERGVNEARQAFDESERKIEEAQIRYAYLKKVDSVQEIRDSFMELKGAQNQLTEKATNRANREEDLKTNEILLKEVSEQVISIENELIGHKEKKAALEPEIRRARELDIRISEAKNNLATAEEEYKVTDKAKNEAVKSVEETHRQIKVTQQATESINQWFGDHDHYQAIIPRTELIINLLKDAATSDDKAASNSKLLKASIEIVEHEKQTLETQKKEAERLNNLLPSEIATLRATLVEGEPCPVCGSLHHPASNVVGDSLEEAKLKKAKADIQRSIDDITKKIDSHNAENIGLKSIIDGYSKSYGESMEKLNGYLTGLPHWQEQFKNGALAQTLQKVAQQWNKYTNELKEAEKQAGMLSTQLTHEQNRAGELIKALTAKKQTFEAATRKNEDLNTERAGLLGGKKADEIEQKLSARQQDLENKFNTLTGRKSEINTTHETYKGIIEQISGEISQLKEKTGSLQHQVTEWLAQQKETMTREELSLLLAKDNIWITRERKALNELGEVRTTALATLTERQKTLDIHHKAAHKPADEETRESLQTLLTEKNSTVKQKTARNTEIEILFANHETGIKKLKAFEKELEEKQTLSENWKKLNELFGSADGAKFKVIAQGYTLEALLAYANKHLKELTNRYELQRVPETLALQVVDLDMLGETRTVHSLSGGESFLISLALALGLSSLSSNRMKVESLFIDEGFGSLDIETLRVAMDALDHLQTQGRKIGVISHVAEMTERLSTQIRVIKSSNGKSRIEVSGV